MDFSLLHPSDLLADESLDQTILDFTLPLPDWLGSAHPETRETYCELLTAYHTAAARLEKHLDDVLPCFDEFANAQLAARIKVDLGVEIDPDRVMIDLPKNVSRDYDIDPQFGSVVSYAAPWVASREREQFSLGELARRNFPVGDEQMAQRLRFAESELNELRYMEAGLTPAYLHGVIPQLDVAQGYRTLLNSVFKVPEPVSEQAQRDANRLIEPYERKLILEAFCALSRHRLSEEGYQVIEMAAQARSRAETDAAHLEMNWVLFKPGHAVSGERAGHTLSGLCAIRDRLTNRTVIYLPDAPGQVSFIEGMDADQARSRLIQRLIATPAMIDYLAERTLDLDNKALHVSYINQALVRRFDGFVSFAPALDLQMAAQQLHTRAWSLFRLNQVSGRSEFDLDRERSLAQNAAYLTYFKAMLGLLPGVGTLISVQDGWNEGHAAARAFKEGRLDDGLLASGSTVLSVLDVVMSIVPGATTVRVLTRYGARAANAAPLTSTATRHVLRPFHGYAAQVSLADAIPQAGRDLGTLRKDGQLWIHREGVAYAVYRRDGEQTLRLKKTATHGYEPPVRFEGEAWVYHTDVGLKGGVKSSIAETLIAKAEPDPAFGRRQARQLLDAFEFPPDRQRRMELEVAIHYEKHRSVPHWAENFRRPAQAPGATVAPGASASTGKRKDAPTADSEAKRTATGTSTSAANVVADPDTWKSWGRPLEDAVWLDQIQTSPPIFRSMGEQGSSFIQLDAKRFDTLPSGAFQHPSIVFLKDPALVDESLTALNATIRRNRHAQPAMASFKNEVWSVHGAMFKRPIHDLVEQARPGLTPASYRVLAEKLFERADIGQPGLTATRLIHLRATLNTWQTGGQAPLASLSDPLSMLEGSRMHRVGTLNPGLNVGSGPSLHTFNRLDFKISDRVLVEKLISAVTDGSLGISGRERLRDFMSAVLTKAGYRLIAPDDAALQVKSMLLFSRSGHDRVYLLQMRRFQNAMPTFRVVTSDSPLPLSNRWIDEWIASNPHESALQSLAKTREQGRLVKLIGGIKVTSRTDAGTQVFVQRIADDF